MSGREIGLAVAAVARHLKDAPQHVKEAFGDILAAIAPPEETGALGWVVVEHMDGRRVASTAIFDTADEADGLRARWMADSGDLAGIRTYTVEPVGAPQGAEPVALCKCGHPESTHTGSWEWIGLKWDDRVHHPGGCDSGWIDESDVGMTCTCRKFRLARIPTEERSEPHTEGGERA